MLKTEKRRVREIGRERMHSTRKDNVTERAAQKQFLLSLPFFAIIEHLLRENTNTQGMLQDKA